MAVSDVDIPRVVSVAEEVELHVSEWNDCRGASVYFTRRLILYLADSHYSILVIVHFNYEYLCLWRDFFVRYFSRRAIDTFQWTFVDVFVGLLVGVLPVLVFLPCLVVEAGTC